MENTTQQLSHHHGRGGGRASSLAYRKSLQLCEDFEGLEEDSKPRDLLNLVKRAGKLIGFSPQMINLLDHYMAYTREIDWEQGSRPIVYKTIFRIAGDIGLSERQVQRLEKQLFEVGAITWNDSGNHKRQGYRDTKTGKLLFAFGVDLTPLAFLKTKLEEKLHEKQLYDAAVSKIKHQISWYRRQIRAVLLEAELNENRSLNTERFQSKYDAICIQIRSQMSLERVRGILAEHKNLYVELEKEISVVDNTEDKSDITSNMSCMSDKNVAHYKSTIQGLFDKSNTDSSSSNCFQESVAEPPEDNFQDREKHKSSKSSEREHQQEQDDLISATGLQHITLKQVLNSTSPRFREYLPLSRSHLDHNFNDVTEAAYRLRKDLHISKQSWSEACEVLGRIGASICIILTDRATLRPENPVTKPAAYFKAMINKARVGELRLHSSIFGILNK